MSKLPPHEQIKIQDMIIQQQHSHSPNNSISNKQSSQIAIPHHIFNEIKQQSERYFGPQAIATIQQLMNFYEEKVYLSYSSSPNQYLQHLLQRNTPQTKEYVSDLLNNKQIKITRAIDNDKYQLKRKSNNIKRIRLQLMDKLADIKSGIQNFSQISQRKQKQQNIYQNFLEFRKKGYWSEKSEKNIKVRDFLRKMRSSKQQISKKYQKDLQLKQEKRKKSQQSLIKQKQQKKKKLVSRSIQRQVQLKKQRIKNVQQNSIKRKQAKNFLKQYRDKKLYIIFQQNYQKQIQKNQKQLKSKLEQIKKARKPLDTYQFEQHAKKYQQFQNQLQEIQLRRQEQQLINSKNQIKLKQLYHSHFHQLIQGQQTDKKYILAEKKKQRQRMIQYACNVEEMYKPKIDPQKKQQVEDTIKQLQLKQDKSKRKKVTSDGIIIYQDKLCYDPKAIGKSYLSHLRISNQGKKRANPQDRSVSMMELKKKTVKIDYLKQMRGRSRGQALSAWKKIIVNKSFSSHDKYESIMDHVQILQQQAKQKQVQLRNNRNKTKAIQLKQEIDKFYLESVSAKMVVLKDIILKQ